MQFRCRTAYQFGETYDKAKTEAQPYWDAARESEARANQCARKVKELEGQIQTLNASILDFAPPDHIKAQKVQIKILKDEQAEAREKERQQRQIAKESQAKGDAIYWPIFNLDKKNPNLRMILSIYPQSSWLLRYGRKSRGFWKF